MVSTFESLKFLSTISFKHFNRQMFKSLSVGIDIRGYISDRCSHLFILAQQVFNLTY